MFKLLSFFLLSYVVLSTIVTKVVGVNGLFGSTIAQNPILFICLYGFFIAHITITAMSLSFHRYHTHKGAVIHPLVDIPMQIWLWMITSLSKVDWVAVHIYHHAHSDQEKDPHSPLHKGLAHALLLGVFDFTKAKSLPEVEKIKKTIHTNRIEKFLYQNSFTGPYLLTVAMLLLFGPMWGGILAVLNFLVSPIFAIGGVNALAHWWGYRNHVTTDNSRNLGFLVPLNFIICGELDHNNHHAHMRSCSFRHRWYEFDIGFVYLTLLHKLKLAQLKNVYSPSSLKKELSLKMVELMERDYRLKKRCEELALDLNTSYQELKWQLQAYYAGEKIKLEKSALDLTNEVAKAFKDHQRLKFRYS